MTNADTIMGGWAHGSQCPFPTHPLALGGIALHTARACMPGQGGCCGAVRAAPSVGGTTFAAIGDESVLRDECPPDRAPSSGPSMRCIFFQIIP